MSMMKFKLPGTQKVGVAKPATGLGLVGQEELAAASNAPTSGPSSPFIRPTSYDPILENYIPSSSLGQGAVVTPQSVSASPWLRMAQDQQASDQANMLGGAPQRQQTALLQNQNALAMRGGLGAGTSARLNRGAGENLALAQQNIRGQGAINAANLGMQGAEINTANDKFNATAQQNANQANVNTGIADVIGQNDQNRFKYGEQMKSLGSERSATALSNASGGKK